MTFKIGQKVVYPTQGIAIVEQIETRQINGEEQLFYLLRLHANNSMVMVPIRNAEEVGLRTLIAKRRCEELLTVLADDFHSPPTAWKDRFKEFSEAMRHGDLFAIAEVLKTLTYLNRQKPLSFREKQMLERAQYLVVSELAMVCRKAESSVSPLVEQALISACHKHTTTA